MMARATGVTRKRANWDRPGLSELRRLCEKRLALVAEQPTASVNGLKDSSAEQQDKLRGDGSMRFGAGGKEGDKGDPRAQRARRGETGLGSVPGDEESDKDRGG